MPVEPCRRCGGSGVVDFPTSPYGHRPLDNHDDDPPCPRCPYMPKLPGARSDGRLVYAPLARYARGFFPDPDTVMWWCFIHQAPVSTYLEDVIVTYDDWCSMAHLWESNGVDHGEPCDFGWVARPVRLKTIEAGSS